MTKMTEADALTRARALLDRSESALSHVSSLILRDQPDAGPELVGGIFDAHGDAKWNPQRDPNIDWSRWGRWEAWEHCVYSRGRATPTGDWVAWDSVTGQQIGFSDKARYSARRQAEMLAVHQNEGLATRVVSLLGAGISALKHRDVRAEIEKRIDADTRVAMQSEAAARD